jgi:Tol biopolymer transport system component
VEKSLPFPAGNYGTFQLAPDGQKLAIVLEENGQFNIWIYDLTEKARTQLTFEGNMTCIIVTS